MSLKPICIFEGPVVNVARGSVRGVGGEPVEPFRPLKSRGMEPFRHTLFFDPNQPAGSARRQIWTFATDSVTAGTVARLGARFFVSGTWEAAGFYLNGRADEKPRISPALLCELEGTAQTELPV